MRTAAVCPECTSYVNAKCVIYNGDYLSTLDVAPSDNLEDILIKINDAIAEGCCVETTTTSTTIGEVNGYVISSATLLYNACSGTGDAETHFLYWLGEFTTGTILYEDPALTIPWDNLTGIFIHLEDGGNYNINAFSNVVGEEAEVCPTTTTTTTIPPTTTTSTTIAPTTTTTTTDPAATTTTTTTDPAATTTTTTTIPVTTTTSTTLIALSVTFLAPGTENHHVIPSYIDWSSNANGSGITEKGVCWSSIPTPTIAGSHQAYGIAEAGYYSVRCYAADGTIYWRGYVTDGVTVAYSTEFVKYIYNY
jgi:hypothetical protein